MPSRFSEVRRVSTWEFLLPTSTRNVGTECWDSHLFRFQHLKLAVPTVPTKIGREGELETRRARDLALVTLKNCRDYRDRRDWAVSPADSLSCLSLLWRRACLACGDGRDWDESDLDRFVRVAALEVLLV